MSHRHPRRSTRASRWTIAITTLFMLGSVLPLSAAPAVARPPAAGAVASGFLHFKYPSPQPLCDGLRAERHRGPVLHARGTAASSSFGVTGASHDRPVRADLVGPNGATFATADAAYDAVERATGPSGSTLPQAGRPAGSPRSSRSTARKPGRDTIRHTRLLGAQIAIDPAGAPFAPGDDVPIVIVIGEMDNASDADRRDPNRRPRHLFARGRHAGGRAASRSRAARSPRPPIGDRQHRPSRAR